MHLADFLRERLNLTATHLRCEQGACGACTLLIDGQPARSCITYTRTLRWRRNHHPRRSRERSDHHRSETYASRWSTDCSVATVRPACWLRRATSCCGFRMRIRPASGWSLAVTCVDAQATSASCARSAACWTSVVAASWPTQHRCSREMAPSEHDRCDQAPVRRRRTRTRALHAVTRAQAMRSDRVLVSGRPLQAARRQGS